MPRKSRSTVEENIYKDNHGYEIIVTRKGRRVEKRYPKHTTVRTLCAHRDRIIHDLEQKAKQAAPGTLNADVEQYLRTLPTGRMKDDRARELQPWLDKFGAFQRSEITPQMTREALASWGKAPSTQNHRRQALKAVYKTLDGPTAITPVDDVKRAMERKEIRAISPRVVAAILRQLEPSKTAARIKVLARTGLPHAQIARLQPHDVNLTARTIHVTPRRKGAGTRARTLPLTHAAVRAFRLMARFDAWGTFSRHSLYKSFKLAVTKAKQTWPGVWPAPENIRPYDLRHAFLTEVYRRTKDLRATAELGLHSDLGTTARYAESAVSATASAARDAMDTKILGTARKHAKKR